MGKARRFHLHRQLDDNSCDATHQTERIGNPQTLIVTKTRKSYQASQQKRCKELDALARLRSLCSKPVNSAQEEPPAKRQKYTNVKMSLKENREIGVKAISSTSSCSAKETIPVIDLT